jgi:sortase A
VIRRSLRALSGVLIAAGVMLLLNAGVTVVWQEPVSALMARMDQGQLSGDLEALESAVLPPAQASSLERLDSQDRRMAFLARSLKRRTGEGEAVGRIAIDRIGIDFVVVAGTDAASLRSGPGHYPESPLPGGRGTVSIAGHRTTYMAPFRNIDRLRAGDEIVMTMPYGRFTYEVERRRIVPPTATWVTNRVSYDRLVLTACHPVYSAAERLVVFARLTGAEPRGAARGAH